MDDGWSSSTGAVPATTDTWSGSATTVDYGNNIGRAYSNNTTLTGTEPTTPSASGGFPASGRTEGGGGGGGYSRSLNPKAQLNIERMPFETSVETIRNIFGRYGRISRIICDYRIAEERLNCWMDYEDERVCEAALRENGRRMEKSSIVVMKTAGGGDDSYRARIPKKDAWGNNTWNKGDRNSGGGANTSTASLEGADWNVSADWTAGGSSTGGGDSSTYESYGDGDDRRSSRGRGRGGRDRGSRGGGRGRGGGGGGGRYQPYDKNEPYEKPERPSWETIVGEKSSAPSGGGSSLPDWNSEDAWSTGGSAGASASGGGGSGGNEPSQPTSAPQSSDPSLDWD